MPKLHRFRLDRKTSAEKTRKNPELMKKRLPCKFSRLFQFSEINLPVELQKFVSKDRRISDGDFSKNNTSKIRVILKINESKDTPSCLTINKNQNCVGLIDPTPSRRSQTSNSSINLFPFDSIFTENDPQNSLLSNSIIDPIMDFFKGRDACIFSFGNSGLGKTKTMIGSDQSTADLGIIPCALVWVFKVMEQLKLNKQTRYAIRISAMEIANKNVVRDLLANATADPIDPTNPGAFLLENSNTIVNNQKELPAASLQDAARILDGVFATRSSDNESLTHLQLIIHLYQYQLEKSTTCEEAVAKPIHGGRSRLHFLDLGSGRHGSDDPGILSLQGMSKVILALYTSQRHIPYKDNVLTQLLKETIGVNTIATMIVHISSKEQNYNDTLQIVQLASKLYRTRSRKSRSVGFLISDETSSCSSSSSGFHSRRLRPHMGIGAARRSSGNSSASSELDMTSASELSCCETVIFRGNTNISGSEKSFDQRSVKHNPMSGSSESDLVLSDKESSRLSSNTLSPSAIRRRRISPRTNARAWPSPSIGTNTATDSGPELWVDGPNAVYKNDRKHANQCDPITEKPVPKEPFSEPVHVVNKPPMMSKETQCDDVWDSSSSLTDGSSHSNTLDRKDHRPLSDISECTEETESNLATETECSKINILNDICPINDLDELLESTFGLSPLHHDLQPGKISGNEVNYLKKPIKSPPPSDGHQETEPCAMITKDANLESPACSPINISKIVENEKTKPNVKNGGEIRKHYHSASDSKRSTKSEQKERKTKSKCKKCSKKSKDQPSTSLTSSNSTDFSRVASWIQNVEYEIQTSVVPINNEDDVFLDHKTRSYEYSHHTHHQSQPDISYQREHHRHTVRATQGSLYPLQYHQHYPAGDTNHVRYSLYGAYHPTDTLMSQADVTHMHIHSATPHLTYASHLSQHSNFMSAPPLHSPKSARDHVPVTNPGYGRHSVSSTQPPLPPLPQQGLYGDSRVPVRNSSQNPVHSSPSPIRRHTKCKTLPRDMYSDPVSPLKRNKSDIHPSKAAKFKGQSLTAMPDIKCIEKVKKDSKNIISILFAPFISLRNKINRGKSNIDKQTIGSENDADKSLQRQPDFNNQMEFGIKTDPEFLLSSPYHLVTPPKTSTLPTESSSHGSDSSSLQNRASVKNRLSETSKAHKCRNKSANSNSKNTTRQRPTSSGYGSIIVKGDSEVSSHNDSSSEYSISGPKVLSTHGRMKHSISLSNCKSVTDTNVTTLCQETKFPRVDNSIPIMSEAARLKNITTAQDLILQEKLKISLHEERRVVIEYIETNRLRGMPVDARVMNLICFKGVDNFEISTPVKREECRSMIERIDQEIEQLKEKLTQAQNHLFLITTFDSKSQSMGSS